MLDVVDEGLLDFAFAPRVGGAEEVEEVWILEDLLGEIGVAGRKGGLEVRQSLALSRVRAGFDLQDEDAVGPAMLARLARVSEAISGIVELLEQRDVVVPGDLCKRLLHDCALHRRVGGEHDARALVGNSASAQRDASSGVAHRSPQWSPKDSM